MKIYLSKYWRMGAYVEYGFIIFIIIGTGAFCMWFRNPENYIIISCAAMDVLTLGGVLVLSKRFLTYVVVESHLFHAFSFYRERLCTVDIDKTVYYVVFRTPQGRLLKEFIALSNEPFEYQPLGGRPKRRFIQYYDFKKLVILPYNEKTFPLLKLEEWHRVSKTFCKENSFIR